MSFDGLLFDQLAAARRDVPFAERLQQRMVHDRPLLDRMAIALPTPPREVLAFAADWDCLIEYDPRPVRWHGRESWWRERVAAGRRAVLMPPRFGDWLYAAPEVCGWDLNVPVRESPRWVWLGGGTVLVCPGCGLDGT